MRSVFPGGSGRPLVTARTPCHRHPSIAPLAQRFLRSGRSPPPLTPLIWALIRARFCGAKSVSGCKAQGGWGGSAHYPDPTAQSAFLSRAERRHAPRTAPDGHGLVCHGLVGHGLVGHGLVGHGLGGHGLLGHGLAGRLGGRRSRSSEGVPAPQGVVVKPPCARLSRARRRFPCRWLESAKSTLARTPQVKHPVAMTQRGPTCLRMSSLTAMAPCSR